MGITYDGQTKTFHLQSERTSYIIQVYNGYLAHLYWGKKIDSYNHGTKLRFKDRSFSPNPDLTEPLFSLDTMPQEYPAFGNTDFHIPAYQIQLENGTTVTNFQYKSHRIVKGKDELDGLPATYVESDSEAQTLELTLIDEVIDAEIIVSYTVFTTFDVMTRSVRFVNNGSKKLKLLKAASVNVDFRESDFELITLPGAWSRERYMEREKLRSGIQMIESRRGASSHQFNPFLALVRPETTEEFGEVFGFNLVYSGNFQASVEVDQFQYSRVTMGINPFDFSWVLDPGQTFQTPEAVMVYSDQGLGGMSKTFHHLYRDRLCRGKYRNQLRPILINNWEATYFDFNEEKIVDIANASKQLGIELFVLDDGWFGKRNSDKGSLGDWFVDRDKLPNGIEHLANQIVGNDMQFGLWFEPEMISVDSDLYRAHPDWCIHVPDRSRSEGRNQLILDLTRKEVCDEVIKRVSDILASAPISYVKWDMNRHMTEVGSISLPAERQRETAHRYILGVYYVMDQITNAFPDVLFESCSGGGGRFDPGILYYMPQTWTSDNTDAISRLKIQYGTSLIYPISAMGSHVSAVPNHQVNRMTSLDIRGHVAMSGNFGYELDVSTLSEEEKMEIKEQVNWYKGVRPIIQFGDFYRLKSPFVQSHTSWMFVSDDQTEAVLAYFSTLAEANAPFTKVKLRGLDPNNVYKIVELDQEFTGQELMYAGVNIPELHGDFQSIMWTLQAKY
ncbi:alpha-galactosidase [Halalkalibacter sp. APA_J-10(15)]|uniref:alpha-galactosidase n=1 Tax=Halalkalibacter sp. APA_J-10(15) TaxID=2933805 RepID=UPI001FF6238B|nr:alpha-galactosidase [Halalkalibacter sp. APA_J-10(15)]MCK0471234.1 alpha-galactosidase [Halalkalibacter sp. APA_J-10(15)]